MTSDSVVGEIPDDPEEKEGLDLDDCVQNMVMTLHDVWCNHGGNSMGPMELQSLNDVLSAFFGDKI